MIISMDSITQNQLKAAQVESQHGLLGWEALKDRAEVITAIHSVERRYLRIQNPIEYNIYIYNLEHGEPVPGDIVFPMFTPKSATKSPQHRNHPHCFQDEGP